MNSFFKKYQRARQITACFMVLYMMHAFSITSLLASSYYNNSHTALQNTHIASNTADKNVPNKNSNNKPFSLFVAKHSIVKYSQPEKEIPAPVMNTEVIPTQEPTAFIPQYNSPTYRLPDDAYKRYRLFRVFLV